MNQIKELMGMIGKKRFLVLALLLVLNVVMAGAWQRFYLPQFSQLTSEKSRLDGERMRLQKETRELPSKYDAMKKNEAAYDKFMTNGFTLVQDRIEARQKLNDLRIEAGLRGVSYDIQPQKKIELDQSYAMTDQFVESDINVNLKALTDVEIRAFIDAMKERFSGLVLLKNIEFSIASPMTLANLQKLSNKEPIDFILGKATFEWYSLVPKTVDANSATAEAFGGVAQ